jgi:hypothetical protein
MEIAKNIIARENMSRCRSHAVLKTGIWTITNSESSVAETSLFLVIAFPTEKIDIEKRPYTKIENDAIVV